MKEEKLLYEICRDLKIIKYILGELYKSTDGKHKGKMFVDCADNELREIEVKQKKGL